MNAEFLAILKGTLEVFSEYTSHEALDPQSDSATEPPNTKTVVPFIHDAKSKEKAHDAYGQKHPQGEGLPGTEPEEYPRQDSAYIDHTSLHEREPE